jgi:hypothetical protein
MKDKSPGAIRQAAQDIGSLQVLSHFGGEFERKADGSIRGYERNDGVVGVDTNDYYRDFISAMREIGYRGYFGYELCHQLPIVDGNTVGIEYAHHNAELAAKFLRPMIQSRS